MTNRFTALLEQKPFLLADGATGTNLFAMGLATGEAPELWNSEFPERVTAHYQSFADAGSDIILTNSFGGSRYRLMLHQAEDRVHELNVAAARIARAVADNAGRPIAVAGSMGPTGEIFAPLGDLDPDDAVAAFSEQALALKAGGVDVLWIETISSREELSAAVAGAGAADLPVVCTMSFDTNGRTMMGLAPSELPDLAHSLHPHPSACGANCGVGAAEMVASILAMRQGADAAARSPLLVAKANCGIPEFVDGKIVYNGTPELMARFAMLARDAGARIIGGCCGTTPTHVRAMREALDSQPPGPPPSVDALREALGEISTGATALAAGHTSIEAGAASGARVRKNRRRR